LFFIIIEKINPELIERICALQILHYFNSSKFNKSIIIYKLIDSFVIVNFDELLSEIRQTT